MVLTDIDEQVMVLVSIGIYPDSIAADVLPPYLEMPRAYRMNQAP